MWLTRGHTIQYTYNIDLKTIKYDIHDIEFFTQLTTENFAYRQHTARLCHLYGDVLRRLGHLAADSSCDIILLNTIPRTTIGLETRGGGFGPATLKSLSSLETMVALESRVALETRGGGIAGRLRPAIPPLTLTTFLTFTGRYWERNGCRRSSVPLPSLDRADF